MQPDVLIGLVLSVVGLVVAVPAVVRSSALELRLMLAVCGLAAGVALAFVGIKSDHVSGDASCGSVLSPSDHTPDGVYSGCDRAVTDARWSVLFVVGASLVAAFECGGKMRRRASADVAAPDSGKSS